MNHSQMFLFCFYFLMVYIQEAVGIVSLVPNMLLASEDIKQKQNERIVSHFFSRILTMSSSDIQNNNM